MKGGRRRIEKAGVILWVFEINRLLNPKAKIRNLNVERVQSRLHAVLGSVIHFACTSRNGYTEFETRDVDAKDVRRAEMFSMWKSVDGGEEDAGRKGSM